MKRKASLLFLVLVSVLVFSAVAFIQSRYFAGLAKGFITQKIPSDLGVQSDFSDFQIRLRRALRFVNRRWWCRIKILLNIPGGSTVTAERIDFPGFIRCKCFRDLLGSVSWPLWEATLSLSLVPRLLKNVKTKTELKEFFQWDQLFQVRVEAVTLENSKLHLEYLNPAIEVDLFARALSVSQGTARGGLGYSLGLMLEHRPGQTAKGARASDSRRRWRTKA